MVFKTQTIITHAYRIHFWTETKGTVEYEFIVELCMSEEVRRNVTEIYLC